MCFFFSYCCCYSMVWPIVQARHRQTTFQIWLFCFIPFFFVFGRKIVFGYWPKQAKYKQTDQHEQRGLCWQKWITGRDDGRQQFCIIYFFNYLTLWAVFFYFVFVDIWILSLIIYLVLTLTWMMFKKNGCPSWIWLNLNVNFFEISNFTS